MVLTPKPGPRCYDTGALATWRWNGSGPADRRRQVRRRALPRLHHGRRRRTPRRHAKLPEKPRRGETDDPRRSPGGHRRYSRYQLRVAARARELVDHGPPLDAACRIIILEDELQEAMGINAEHRRGEKRTASESPRHDRAH